jgi:hypothetical protein
MAAQQDPGRSRRRRRGGSDRAAEPSEERTERTERMRNDYRPTQLSFSTALRAREVATPTPRDLAEAADEVVLVRRHYVPPASRE